MHFWLHEQLAEGEELRARLLHLGIKVDAERGESTNVIVIANGFCDALRAWDAEKVDEVPSECRRLRSWANEMGVTLMCEEGARASAGLPVE